MIIRDITPTPVTIDVHSYAGDIYGSWQGPRTQRARRRVRVLAARAAREHGLEAGSGEVRVRWDGTWMIPYRELR